MTLASMSYARLCSSAISSLSVIQNSRDSLTSCSAYSARSCDRVNLPLVILSDSRVTISCCSNDPTLARGVIISCMADDKLARMVSMSFPTDSICSGGGGTAVSGGDGEGNLDLLPDTDGKSDGGGEDDDGKSDGGDDNDGISDSSSGW
ncbi:hypothetical protein Tco_0230016 [Tanacetum coccineum]